jgi:hypothetical protein
VVNSTVSPLYTRYVEDMDVDELCSLLSISPEDIIERFSDRILELGIEKSSVTPNDWDDDDYEIGVSLDDLTFGEDWTEMDDDE